MAELEKMEAEHYSVEAVAHRIAEEAVPEPETESEASEGDLRVDTEVLRGATRAHLHSA